MKYITLFIAQLFIVGLIWVYLLHDVHRRGYNEGYIQGRRDALIEVVACYGVSDQFLVEHYTNDAYPCNE